MSSNTNKSFESLRGIFRNNLTVDLLSENIITCSLNDDALAIKQDMHSKDFDYYGVEKDDRIIGYIRRENLKAGNVGEYYKNFTSEDLTSDSTSLIELLYIFQNRDCIFILEKNTVRKLVTVSDLHKQPIRMLAFSLISLLEIHLNHLIREAYPNDSWTEKLSENRIDTARSQLSNRLAKNEALTLLDNIQLGDKGTIIRKTNFLVERLGFESKSKCKEFFSQLETLRNNTAHSQEVIYHDYKELIEIILRLEKVIQS